jgi:ubiquinone/menaquinone biosynthesis C-methylase UbiE
MALFDKKAVAYDDWCKTQVGHFVDSLEKNLMKEVAKPMMGENALDLGCGTGIYSYWLLEQGLSVTGVDISSEMLKVAKTKRDSEKIQFLQGDIYSLPFPNETFDLVVSNIVLEFTNNPKQVVKEALRVLKHGGRFVCGLIGKESDWGKMYQDHGNQDT